MGVRKASKWMRRAEIGFDTAKGRIVLAMRGKKTDKQMIARDIRDEVYFVVIEDLMRGKPLGDSFVMTHDGKRWFAISVRPVAKEAVRIALARGKTD